MKEEIKEEEGEDQIEGGLNDKRFFILVGCNYFLPDDEQDTQLDSEKSQGVGISMRCSKGEGGKDEAKKKKRERESIEHNFHLLSDPVGASCFQGLTLQEVLFV
ncbi:MAG: hypothetical protein ABII26_12155 [Pseudomonadota bacterium]